MSEETYEGIPRSQIPWAPKINYKKCVSCGKCVDFCHMKAFGFKESNCAKKIVVKNLDACIVFCRGSEDICYSGAISHPSEEETQKIIDNFKKTKF
jgi:NAD-dependent dihydropyrimidine dehydrogenase PreA subunit